MIHRTHCALRLGDNLQHLQFLRKLAQAHVEDRFIHYAHFEYIHQLAEVVSDLPNLSVCDLETVSDGDRLYWDMQPRPLLRSIDAWKNAGGYWEHHDDALNYGAFYVKFFHHLAQQMRLECPIHNTADLLFDYPALRRFEFPAFDCLVINSPPKSGQLPAYDVMQMEHLVHDLAQKHRVVTTARTRLKVPCTIDRAMTVTQIGALSRFCRYIIMVATGPCWPTFNVFNSASVEFRLILLGSEKVELAPNTAHAANFVQARKILQLRGIL